MEINEKRSFLLSAFEKRLKPTGRYQGMPLFSVLDHNLYAVTREGKLKYVATAAEAYVAACSMAALLAALAQEKGAGEIEKDFPLYGPFQTYSDPAELYGLACDGTNPDLLCVGYLSPIGKAPRGIRSVGGFSKALKELDNLFDLCSGYALSNRQGSYASLQARMKEVAKSLKRRRLVPAYQEDMDRLISTMIDARGSVLLHPEAVIIL